MKKRNKPKDITAAARALGRLGGSVTSEAKTQAARANAKLPRNKTPRTLKPFAALSRAQQSRRIAAILAAHPAIGTDEWFALFGAQVLEARRLVAKKRPVAVTHANEIETGDHWVVYFENRDCFQAEAFSIEKYSYHAARKAADKYAAAWNAQCGKESEDKQ